MSIQKFSFEALQKVRKYIQSGLVLPNLEKQIQAATSADMPEPESVDDLSGLFNFGGVALAGQTAPNLANRWIISTVNPAAPLLKLPGLSLKPDLRLVAYLYRDEAGSAGIVWAVPEEMSGTAQLEATLADTQDWKKPPKPEGSLEHYMAAIAGDRSPVSYLVASILKRELREFGASGNRRSWSFHHLISTLPTDERWNWQGSPPKDLSPKVRILDDGQAAVEFFSIRKTLPHRLYRHMDHYPVGQYRPQSSDKPIAIAS
ncbi:hypothetical protein ACQ4M4_08175 [Leptolyngbya sp. AN02str]|uniref:hypothetical protein n=1 Tax=Leptolyngbya sp. AN02str TaxID=3423363 RepID=UPI003D3217A4